MKIPAFLKKFWLKFKTVLTKLYYRIITYYYDSIIVEPNQTAGIATISFRARSYARRQKELEMVVVKENKTPVLHLTHTHATGHRLFIRIFTSPFVLVLNLAISIYLSFYRIVRYVGYGYWRETTTVLGTSNLVSKLEDATKAIKTILK